MKIGRLVILWRKRVPYRRYQVQGYELAESDLAPEVRAVIARVARAVAKDYLQEWMDEHEGPGYLSQLGQGNSGPGGPFVPGFQPAAPVENGGFLGSTPTPKSWGSTPTPPGNGNANT